MYVFNFGFSFIYCCLIWCGETRAGTNQAHKYFSQCSNLQLHLVAATYHTCIFAFSNDKISYGGYSLFLSAGVSKHTVL